jgi:CheY-like chemotaxis protein
MPVLLVEDELEDIDQARNFLSKAGIDEVKVFSHASTAIEFLERVVSGGEKKLRGILLDLMLEHESGFEVLRFYHDHPELKNVPVVVWTRVSGNTERQIAHWLGAKKFLTKNTGEQSMITHLRETFSTDNAPRLP